MNVLVSSAPFPRAHPPRSNPFLRSSDAAPFPCITPSMVTWVMVISFMIAAPTLAPPLVGGLTPATNTTAPIRHRLPDFFQRTFRDAGRQRSDSTTVSRRQRSTTSSAYSADKLWDQIDREDPDLLSAHAALRQPSGSEHSQLKSCV